MALKLPVRESADLVPADMYMAKFTGYEEIVTEYGPAVKLYFLITEGAEKDKIVNGLASIPANGLTPKSKLRIWIEGMLGRKLAGVTEEIDLDKLIGRPCRLNLSVTEGAKGGQFNRIESILPPRSTKPVKALDEDPDLGF